jgi:hypothetical protein
MNKNIRIFLFCPVPENQKPITEFLLFQETAFFQWITKSKKKYQQNFFSIVLLLFVSFFFSSSLFFFFFFILFFSFFPVLFRCSQLEERLKNSRLFYEEGSWYDGQIWEKPFSLIKNERLISTQKIQPIFQRISIVFLGFLFFIPIFLIF